MPSPFPGMDPWLEHPGFWPEVHENLIIRLQDALAPLLRPRYYVVTKQRTVFAVAPSDSSYIIPDVAVLESPGLADHVKTESTAWAEPMIVEVPIQEKITEDYLEVVKTSTHEVVTVMEILSWSNKTPGRDRRAYERKRERIFQTPTHLVEIDLLRAGEPMPFTFRQTNGHFNHYRILVKRGEHERRAFLYPFNLRDPLPVVPLPLQQGDVEPPIPLGELFKQTYEACGYDMRINYHEPPEPPLSDADTQWAAEILRAADANR